MKRIAVALALICIAAVPTFAATISSEITIPAAGRVVLPDVTYYTEVTLTNHRDAIQTVAVELIDGKGGGPMLLAIIQMLPHQSTFAANGFLSTNRNYNTGVGAMRFTALHSMPADIHHPDLSGLRDPAGQIEVKAFVVKERGPFGVYGSTRQEIEGIPIAEYTAKESIFVGVLHQPPTYTNVGIVNLHPTETVTFYVQYQYLEPVAVTIPPLTTQQVRVAGGRGNPREEGNGGRWVSVKPEWADDGSGRTTPWVAYASTIDGITGDAFSGLRLPPDADFRKK